MSIKGYLFECPENDLVHRMLTSRAWRNGSEVILPPIRVTRFKTMMYGQYFVVHMYRPPITYQNAGYLPQKKYRLKTNDDKTWKLKIVK